MNKEENEIIKHKSPLELALEKEQLRVKMLHEELIKDMDKMSVYQKENERLKKENKQLKSNRDEAIEHIKHSWWLRTDQTYDTSKDLKGWEVEKLLEILGRSKKI